MDCSDFIKILDVPERLREPEDASMLETHLRDCPSCAQLSEKMDDALRLLTAPEEEARAEVMENLLARVRRDRDAAVAGNRETNDLRALPTGGPRAPTSSGWVKDFSKRIRELLGPARIWAPALATLLLVVWIFTPGSGIRQKGRVGEKLIFDVDLQLVVERPLPSGGYEIESGRDGIALGANAGLIFEFLVEGKGSLLLIERDPNHKLSVIFDRSEIESPASEPRRIEILNAENEVLRYVPNGPSGEYTYIGVWSRDFIEPTPEALDALWSTFVDLELKPLEVRPRRDLVLDAIRVEFEAEGGE